MAGIFALLYIGTLAVRPLYTPDEPRYAEIARELIIHNDWVVPKLNNLCYFEKPIMGHWLNALSLKVFGENPFAVRFSSGLLALCTAFMLGWFVKRFTDRRLGFMTTTIYLTMGLVFGVGTYAVLDTPFNFFLTGTMIAFFCASERPKWDHAKIGYLIVAGAFCGGAFLTKGFLAFAIPGTVILAYLIWEKRWKCIFTLPWIPLALVLLTIGPWVIMVHKADGDFWHYFFWVEHFERLTEENSSQHPEGWWFFIPWIFIGPLPWAFFLPQIIKGYGKKYKEFFRKSILRYAVCWAIFPFLLCSASSGKLITYILPCFPAIAVLIAFGLKRYFENGKLNDFNLVLKIFYIALFSIVTLLALAQILFSLNVIPVALYTEDEIYKWVIVALTLTGWAYLAKKAVIEKEACVKFGYFAFGAVIVMMGFHFIVPNIVEVKKAPVPQLAKFKDKIQKDTTLVCYKNLISSVCWTFKRDDVYLYHKAGELTYGLKRKDSAHRLLSKEEFLEKIKDDKKHIVIIMDSNKRRKNLPDYEEGIWENNVFFKEYGVK
jgi:4-amino-4-deoxy-L-arabinose transferase